MILASNRVFAAAARLRPAVALLALVFCIAGPVTWAQNAGSGPATERPPEAQPETQPARGAHRPRSVAGQLDRLSSQLHLTTDQQARVKIILDRRRADMLRLRSVDSLTAMDRFTKVEAAKRDALDEINALLTDEQRKIFRPINQHPEG